MEYPITLHSAANLVELGVKKEACKFGQCSMEGSNLIALRHVNTGNSTQLVIVEMQNNFNVKKITMTAEAVTMHPTDNIAVLRAKQDNSTQLVQVYDFDIKKKMKTHTFPERISLCKWISNRTLGLVTEKCVYHWSIDGDTQPQKIFDRTGKFAEPGIQIMNYAADTQQQFCVLTGFSKEADSPSVHGSTMLYSIASAQEKQMDSPAACFGEIMMDGQPKQVLCFAEKAKDQKTMKVRIMDIFSSNKTGQKFQAMGDVDFDTSGNDFPISLHLSKNYGILFMVTKAGYVYLFDAHTATQIFKHKISNEPLFVATLNDATGSLTTMNTSGNVYNVNINIQTVIPYIQNNLTHVPNYHSIAMNFAKTYGLPGADSILTSVFNQHFIKGEYDEAAKIVALMKSGALRTAAVIDQFKNAPSVAGQSSPILIYFKTLLEYGKLNALESKEITKPLVAQGERRFIESWLKDDKLECTEELGDIVKPMDSKLALIIYFRVNASAKIVQTLVESGLYERIITYCNQYKYQPDFASIVRTIAFRNPEATKSFIQTLLNNDPPLIDINIAIDILYQQGRFQDVTSVLLDYLKEDKAEQSHLQTQLFEIALKHSPQFAESIFQLDRYTHFDKQKIATLCEHARLFQRTLELYTDIQDIKRIMMQTGNQFSGEWVQKFFEKQSGEHSLEILTDMLKANRQNMNTVVTVAIKYYEKIGVHNLIKMFESFSAYEGVFYFLGSILTYTQDPETHFKYIEAAAKLNNLQEVERCCRESKYYDPQRVKDFLKQTKLQDPRPLIFVCDLHNYVDEMTEYLYRNNLMKYIEVYVLKVNSNNSPSVLGTLIDLDCPEDFINNLLMSVRGMAPVGPLVYEMEKRNRLRILLPWLEARLSEGVQITELHNALAKIYIDTNKDPDVFLKTNQFYDSKTIGEYCEDRDPHLSYTAYKRGQCDKELINITNINGLYRLQARYLVERKSPELWAYVLTPENEHCKNVIDQVVSTALPDSSNSQEVFVAVKAFSDAKMPEELIELLEKIVLHNSEFSDNPHLQTLLILTAMKANSPKVMDYINRLNNFDGEKIGRHAAQNGFTQEAHHIFKKFNMHSEAINMLLNEEDSLDRAYEYAHKINEPNVWSKLAEKQLNQGYISEALESFMKADDSNQYSQVISAFNEQHDTHYTQFINYLKMARKTHKNSVIDSELVYIFAKAHQLAEMDEFVSGSNIANVAQIGDRLYQEGIYEAAKKLYTTIPNYSKLAMCHIKMFDFNSALEAAKKSGSPKTWKEVCFACVDNNEYECAHTAGLSLIVHPDHLDELIVKYEYQGLFNELIILLEAGINGDRTHVGMYTELGVSYSKFEPEKLMGFCKSYYNKLNISKLIKACEKSLHWNEAIFLHTSYGEFDQAANIMMTHTPTTWDAQKFINIMTKVSNSDYYYKAIQFYLDFYPSELTNYLLSMNMKLDHFRVVSMMKTSGYLPLIEVYLMEVQPNNISVVNDAVNDIHLENSNYEKLSNSVKNYNNFDQITMARKLEKHTHTEFRKISCYLFKINKMFKEALNLSLKDKQYVDAIDVVRTSENFSYVFDLLKFFVESNEPNYFSACLHTCYDYLKPDVVLEMAWKKGWINEAMPYMIQVIQEYTNKTDELGKKEGQREIKEEKQKSAPNDYLPDMMLGGNSMLPGFGNLAILPPPSMNTMNNQANNMMTMTGTKMNEANLNNFPSSNNFPSANNFPNANNFPSASNFSSANNFPSTNNFPNINSTFNQNATPFQMPQFQ